MNFLVSHNWNRVQPRSSGASSLYFHIKGHLSAKTADRHENLEAKNSQRRKILSARFIEEIATTQRDNFTGLSLEILLTSGSRDRSGKDKQLYPELDCLYLVGSMISIDEKSFLHHYTIGTEVSSVSDTNFSR
jgi:hypothetical protein